MGDSHTMTDINPRLYNNAVNMGYHGEPLYITQLKAEKLKKEHSCNNLTLIISFGPQNLSDFNEEKLLISTYAKGIWDTYYPLLLPPNPLSKEYKLQYNKRSYLNSILKNMCLYPRTKHNKWQGHFEERDYALDTADLQETIQRHYYTSSQKVRKVSPAAILALDALCQNKQNISIFLIILPVHPAYKNKIPQSFLDTFKKLVRKYEKQGVPILNYLEYPMPDSTFYDYDHLNKEGARIFASILKADLKKLLQQQHLSK